MDKTTENTDVLKLIEHFKTEPQVWLLSNLWQEQGIAVVHSLEGQFKSFFVFQLGEALAKGESFLRIWPVESPRMVGIYESEMSDFDSGHRLLRMFPNTADVPMRLRISDDEFRREMAKRPSMDAKFEALENWIAARGVEVLIIDTCNSLLASAGSPNDEPNISRFLDHLALLPVKGILLVRHDSKPTRDNALRHDNQKVRGSNRLVEEASVVVRLNRPDRAANKVRLSVGKVRSGSVPGDVDLWFDADTFRLTPLPPVIAMLESGPLTREELLEQGERFGLKRAAIDNHIADVRSFLVEEHQGHKRVFKLDAEALSKPVDDDKPTTWIPLVKLPQFELELVS